MTQPSVEQQYFNVVYNYNYYFIILNLFLTNAESGIPKI